jgi:4-hydroxythreonine-4-phosphate dehydrogenase
LKKPLLITPGDPLGIGPEVTAKALKMLPPAERFECILVGVPDAFRPLKSGVKLHPIPSSDAGEFLLDWINRKVPRDQVYIISPKALKDPTTRKGRLSRAGFYSGSSIELATNAVLTGLAAALVTGPISKENFQSGGFPFQGHTDFLGHLCKVKQPTMMLANDSLRVTLVTVHTALSQVPKLITSSRVLKTIETTLIALRTHWGIESPKVAVLGLNPHAGEGGLFGSEERRFIQPAIALARKKFPWATIHGPLPSDTLFAKNHLAPKHARYDATVCMYHDQGLIPVKLLDFPKTVNVSLGLPIIRTSVDHGTAFDIAGKNLADPSSMLEAIRLARSMVRNRTKISPRNHKDFL